MAITKTIEIDVNTLQAVGGLDNLDKALKKVDNSATNLDATFEEVYGDLKPLTARMGEAEDRLYELALAGQSASQEYKDLLASVGQYRQVQMKTDMVVDAAATTFDTKLGGALQGATSAFAGVQGAMALTGGQSQELEEALLKVQGAMALAEGVRGIREGSVAFKALATSAQKYTIVQKVVTAAQWLWNTAMAANPIGAIIAGIVALVAAGVALTKFFMSNAEAAKINTATVEKNRIALENQTKTLDKNANAFSRKQSQELAMAKASGLSAKAIRNLELKLIDEKIAFEKSQRAIAENTYQKNLNTLASLKAADADADLIKKQSEITNESIKQYNKQNQDVQKAFDEKKDIQNRHLVEVKSSEVNSSKEIAQKRKEAAEKAKADAIQAEKDKKDALERIRQGEIDTEAERRAEEKRQIQKQYEELIAAATKYGQDTTALKEAQLTKEKELADKFALEDAEKQKAKTLKEQEEKIKNLELSKEFDNLTFEEKREELKTKEDLLLQDKTLTEEQRKDIEKQYSDARIQIGQAEAQAKEQQLANISGALQSMAAIAGESTTAGKAFAVASTAISTYSTAQKAYESAFLPVPTVASPALGTAFAAIAVAGGLMNIKKILSVKTPKGGSGGSVPSISGAGGGGTPAAPSFNVVGNSGVNQIAQTLGSQQPVQAYVVANNVTTAQALDRNIIQNASIG